MAKRPNKLRWMADRWREAPGDRDTLEFILENVHQIEAPRKNIGDHLQDLFAVAFGWGRNSRAPDEAWRDIGWLLAEDEPGDPYNISPERLAAADSEHLAIWAMRDTLGVNATDLSIYLDVSKGRVSQLMKPSEPIPRHHRLIILGFLDRAIEYWSIEVKVHSSRQKLIRATRSHTVEMLKAIRDAEAEALFPSSVEA